MRIKSDKFKELAEKRVTRAIKDIRLIGNLSNKGNYDYEIDDVKKIFSVLEKELKAMKARFDENENEIKFKL